MAVGRKKTPTPLNDLRGNPSKRARNKNEPRPPGVDNLKPPHGRLSKHARRMWKDLSPLLDNLGILKETDLAAFELLCNHYGLAIDAAADLRARGLIIEEPVKFNEAGEPTEYKVKKNPAAQIFRENATAFRLFAGEFGLTPASRASLDIKPPEKQLSYFEEFKQMIGAVDSPDFDD